VPPHSYGFHHAYGCMALNMQPQTVSLADVLTRWQYCVEQKLVKLLPQTPGKLQCRASNARLALSQQQIPHTSSNYFSRSSTMFHRVIHYGASDAAYTKCAVSSSAPFKTPAVIVAVTLMISAQPRLGSTYALLPASKTQNVWFWTSSAGPATRHCRLSAILF
jgi:hypothetical protein